MKLLTYTILRLTAYLWSRDQLRRAKARRKAERYTVTPAKTWFYTIDGEPR